MSGLQVPRIGGGLINLGFRASQARQAQLVASRCGTVYRKRSTTQGFVAPHPAGTHI
jgi:hypothetical protein